MFGFGSNSAGQLGIGQHQHELFSTPQRILYRSHTHSPDMYPSAIGCGHSFTAMALDGALYMWGKNDKGQCGIGSLTSSVWSPSLVVLRENVFVTSVACGLEHVLAVTGE